MICRGSGEEEVSTKLTEISANADISNLPHSRICGQFDKQLGKNVPYYSKDTKILKDEIARQSF